MGRRAWDHAEACAQVVESDDVPGRDAHGNTGAAVASQTREMHHITLQTAREGANVPRVTSARADVITPLRRLMDQVQAEYAEMPGLSVTLAQAQRLWAAERATCEEAFRRLTASGVLRATAEGRFVRV